MSVLCHGGMLMKKQNMLFLVLILLFITGCRPSAYVGGSKIDWVDFVKFAGIEYQGIHTGALADGDYVGENIGTVKFKVADNVKNPNYKIRDGDAAFHDKGTGIFEIKDQPHLIAVKNTQAINGYRVYFSSDAIEYQWHFKDMPIEKVELIEIYVTEPPEDDKLIATLSKKEDVNGFLQLLVESKNNPDFQPDVEKADPIFYEMVFYTEEPIAYKYNLQFDGETYYWHPWDTSILSDDIKTFIHGN